jgi:hypothetical protein
VVQEILGRLVDYTQNWLPTHSEGYLHREIAGPVYELGSAIHRVHDPDPFPIESSQVIVRLFGQQSIVGVCGSQTARYQIIGDPIGNGDGLISSLLLHVKSGLVVAHDRLASLAGKAHGYVEFVL